MWITVKSQVIRTRPIRHVTVYDLEQPWKAERWGTFFLSWSYVLYACTISPSAVQFDMFHVRKGVLFAFRALATPLSQDHSAAAVTNVWGCTYAIPFDWERPNPTRNSQDRSVYRDHPRSPTKTYARMVWHRAKEFWKVTKPGEG